MHWRRKWQPTPVFLPGESPGRGSLLGCSPWGLEESDTTEQLHFPFSLSRTGEGNGNPLQCSCLENPRDGGAWWAAVYGVTQSRTRLTRLSSSSCVLSVYMQHLSLEKMLLESSKYQEYTLLLFHFICEELRVRSCTTCSAHNTSKRQSENLL